MSSSSCRFYEAEFPEPDEVVMVKIASINDLGAYVLLEEYNNIQGMISVADLSRRRIRSVQKLVRVGKNEAVVTLRVDKEKGYIDLSKRQASPEEVRKCQEKFERSKTVHSIVVNVAKNLGLEAEDLYKRFGWPLYKKYGHAYDAFKLAITDYDEVLGEYNLEPELKKELMTFITRRLAPKNSKLRADFEMTCYSFQGVEAIRKALKAAEAVSTKETDLQVRLIAPPEYVITTTSVNKDRDIKLMEEALAAADRVIREEGGMIKVTMRPKAVTEHEEKELLAAMEYAERSVAQIAGDDDDSDQDGELD
ncbi:hypothetical protein H4R27_001669 [Coemansia aciculifera]|uniref:S1 motif domain-containing protein n=1 Tax=Coemansia pectinata TaxID=1052879 RepID=A0A9W8GQX7_9FUNG|nr:hypothetical protein GGI19_006275 [Coemansia pectinata]KAJ2885068.1 hypothetical protein H4R27_001669 [Coemansia aciculifera]